MKSKRTDEGRYEAAKERIESVLFELEITPKEKDLNDFINKVKRKEEVSDLEKSFVRGLEDVKHGRVRRVV